MKTIPNKLKEYRLKAGMTQMEVVKAIRLSSNNRLSRWESGKAYPSINNLLKLARLYETEIQNIYSNLEEIK